MKIRLSEVDTYKEYSKRFFFIKNFNKRDAEVKKHIQVDRDMRDFVFITGNGTRTITFPEPREIDEGRRFKIKRLELVQ